MKIKFAVIGAILAFCEVSPASALTLGFNPSIQSVSVGSTTTVDLVISGLGNGVAPSLGTFDLDIGFNPSTLGFSGATFGNQLDLFGLGDVQLVTPGVGTVNLFELSLELPLDLESLQADTFTLATLSFNALAIGSSPLSISVNALGDANGDPLPYALVSRSIDVNANDNPGSVPEPTTWLLLGLGALTMSCFIRRPSIIHI